MLYRTLSYPPDAIRIEPLTSDELTGKLTFLITGVKNPLDRGCGLDGQLYIMQVTLR